MVYKKFLHKKNHIYMVQNINFNNVFLILINNKIFERNGYQKS